MDPWHCRNLKARITIPEYSARSCFPENCTGLLTGGSAHEKKPSAASRGTSTQRDYLESEFSSECSLTNTARPTLKQAIEQWVLEQIVHSCCVEDGFASTD